MAAGASKAKPVTAGEEDDEEDIEAKYNLANYDDEDDGAHYSSLCPARLIPSGPQQTCLPRWRICLKT